MEKPEESMKSQFLDENFINLQIQEYGTVGHFYETDYKLALQ